MPVLQQPCPIVKPINLTNQLKSKVETAQEAVENKVLPSDRSNEEMQCASNMAEMNESDSDAELLDSSVRH